MVTIVQITRIVDPNAITLLFWSPELEMIKTLLISASQIVFQSFKNNVLVTKYQITVYNFQGQIYHTRLLLIIILSFMH